MVRGWRWTLPSRGSVPRAVGMAGSYGNFLGDCAWHQDPPRGVPALGQGLPGTGGACAAFQGPVRRHRSTALAHGPQQAHVHPLPANATLTDGTDSAYRHPGSPQGSDVAVPDIPAQSWANWPPLGTQTPGCSAGKGKRVPGAGRRRHSDACVHTPPHASGQRSRLPAPGCHEVQGQVGTWTEGR